MTIGDPRSWGIDDAQAEARRLNQFLDKGKDPREEKQNQRAAHEAQQTEKRRQEVTVNEAWSEYIEYLKTKISSKTKKARSARYIQDHLLHAAQGGEDTKRGGKRTVSGPLGPLMNLPLSALNAETVAMRLEAEVPSRPTAALYSYRLLKAFVRWCDGKDAYAGIVAADCCTSSKVTDVLPSSGTKEGDCLQREQLVAWFGAVRQLDNPVLSAYLQGLLITGARREELAALRWNEVDFKWRSLSIADKIETNTGRVIPLTPYFASLLLELKRINETPPNVRQVAKLGAKGEKWKPSGWVFASKTAADGRLSEPRFGHKRALAKAGLPHITIHGLRRSFGTLSEWCEVPVGVVAQIQGHKPSAIAEKHYRRRSIDMLRSWHDKIEMWMLEEAGIEFKTESR